MIDLFFNFANYFEDITECRYSDYVPKVCFAIDEDVHIEISIPIMPGFKNNYYDYLFPLKIIFFRTKRNIPIHLLKINPAHLMIDKNVTSDEDILMAKKILLESFDDKYIYI